MSIVRYFAAISLHSQASSVSVFNGSNFSEWSEQVRFHLGALDLDSSLLEEKSTVDENSTDDKKYELKVWEKSRLSQMFMQMTIAINIKTTIPQTESAK